MSLALSLCQYVLRSRRGLDEPQSASIATFEARNLLHQHNRKGKVVMIKTRRYKRQFLGSFFAPEIDMIFGDGVLGRLQLVGLVLAACPTAKNGVAVTRDYAASAS